MTNEDLTTIANVGPEKADRLREAGFETCDDPDCLICSTP